MKKDKKYFLKRCRLCGRCYKESVDIFSSKEKNLKELIHQCLNINVREDDALPKKLCPFCDKKLSLWEKFKSSCENIQVKLIADSLPKKVDIPRSKKANKCSGPGDVPRMLARESTCDKLIEIKADYIRKCSVSPIRGNTYPETMKKVGESGSTISGSKPENEFEEDVSVGLESGPKVIPFTQKIKQKQVGICTDSINTSQDFYSTSTKTFYIPDKNNKSQDSQTEASEITDQEINDLNDTLSKNLNSDKTIHPKVREINNNMEINAVKSTVRNSFLTMKLQEKHSNQLKLTKNIPMKEYHCSICQKTFLSLRKMKIHFKGHSTQTDGLKQRTKRATKKYWQCPLCPRRLTTSFNLSHHLETHSETCNYCCHLCGKLFRTHSSLLNHIRVHLCDEMEDKTKDSVLANGPSIKLFQCQVCDKIFRQSGHLAYHLKMHTGERLYTCSDCGMSFIEKYQLRKHANAVHRCIKRYNCDVCGKQFLHTHNFKDHMLQHGGIANISCDLCGKTFVTNNALSRHRRLHTGEKPFLCDICGKKFRDCSNRKRHRDKHILEAKKALAMNKPKEEEDLKNPLNLVSAVEEAVGGDSSDFRVLDTNQIGGKEKPSPACEGEMEGQTYMSLKTYFESNEDVSMRNEVKGGGRMILPIESLVTAVSSHNPGLLQPIPIVGNIDDSSNPAPLLGCGLFGEEMDLNSESLLLIGDGRVNNALLEGSGADSTCIKDQLVWVPSSSAIQGGDVGLNSVHSGDSNLRGIHSGAVDLTGIQNVDAGLPGIQVGDIGLGGIQGGDITGILEVGMGLCGDFDVNSGIEMDSGKDDLPDDFPSIGEIKEVEENEKAFDNVLCLQVF